MNQTVMEKRPCAFISGAAVGIGRATARLLVKQGWFVGLGDIDTTGLDTLRDELGAENAMVMPLDVIQSADWESALSAFFRQTGRLDVSLNNAGILISGNFESNPLVRHHAVLDINIKGVFNGCYSALPYLQKTPNARVINLSSSAAIYGQAALASYSSSKFAVRGLTEALNIEWQKYGIRVIDIMPLFVQTAMLTQMDARSFEVFGAQLTAEDVAQHIYQAAQYQHYRKVHWPVGWMAACLMHLTALSPAWLNRLLVKRMTT